MAAIRFGPFGVRHPSLANQKAGSFWGRATNRGLPHLSSQAPFHTPVFSPIWHWAVRVLKATCNPMYYDARLAAPRLTQGHFRHRLPLCIVLAATAILITLCRPTSPPKASHFVPYIVPPPLGLPAPRVVAAYSRHPSQIAASAQYPWIVPGVGRSRTALSAEYWVGDKGIKVLKPSKAADIQRVRRRPRPPPAPSIYERLEQQKQFEITDQRAKDIAADLIRQVYAVLQYAGRSVPFASCECALCSVRRVVCIL